MTKVVLMLVRAGLSPEVMLMAPAAEDIVLITTASEGSVKVFPVRRVPATEASLGAPSTALIRVVVKEFVFIMKAASVGTTKAIITLPEAAARRGDTEGFVAEKEVSATPKTVTGTLKTARRKRQEP